MIKKINRVGLLFLASVLIFSLGSCSKVKKMEKEEHEKIQEYLSSNPDMSFTQTKSGLRFMEVLEGTGVMPVEGDSAFVKYSGKFLDGYEFDSNINKTGLYGFIMGENITGFDEGLTMMKEGGKATLLIPSYLAYGSNGSYPYITGYTPLLFELHLVKVKAAGGE